jgi:hypothetical protein
MGKLADRFGIVVPAIGLGIGAARPRLCRRRLCAEHLASFMLVHFADRPRQSATFGPLMADVALVRSAAGSRWRSRPAAITRRRDLAADGQHFITDGWRTTHIGSASSASAMMIPLIAAAAPARRRSIRPRHVNAPPPRVDLGSPPTR